MRFEPMRSAAMNAITIASSIDRSHISRASFRGFLKSVYNLAALLVDTVISLRILLRLLTGWYHVYRQKEMQVCNTDEASCGR